jgi:hypothetical protein
MAYLGFFLTFIGGCALAANGYGVGTWQYWAIAPALVVGGILVGRAS